MRKTALLFTVLLTAACTVGPELKKPVIITPEKWSQEQGGEADLVNSRWWQQFGDSRLDSLIDETVKGNLDLQLAVARIEQFSAALETVKSGYYPQIGVLGDGAGEKFGGRTSDRYRLGATALWEPDLWGKIRKSDDAARAQLLATEAGRRGVVLSLVSSAASGYINLRSLDRQQEIAIATEKAYLETFELFKLRYKYGTVSQLEISQIESQYESARQAVPKYATMIRQQENLLSLLAGRVPGTIARGKTIEELAAPQVPMSLPSELLQRRPDIIQAEQELVAANAAIGIYKAAYFPSVSINGLLGVAAGDVGKLFSTGSDYWSASGAVTVPILTFGKISGQVKQAEAQEKQAKIRYQQTVLGAFRDVEDAVVAASKGREQLAAQRRQVAALSEYARISRLQFDSGTANYLQVLDADRSNFTGQLALVQGQYELLGAIVTVYKSLGGGWVDKVME